MAQRKNILVSTFSGVLERSTLNYVLPNDATWDELFQALGRDLRPSLDGLILSTYANRKIEPSRACIDFDYPYDEIVPLRLSARLPGGKGGFGSQLRAAGGRMSSRKKKDKDTEATSSNRNLDGRRLRTIHETKRLADHLAKQSQSIELARVAKREEWKQLIEASSAKELDIKNDQNGLHDTDWSDYRNEAEDMTRLAMRSVLTDGMTEPDDGEDANQISMDVSVNQSTSLDSWQPMRLDDEFDIHKSYLSDSST